MTLKKTIPVGQRPRGLAVSPDRKTVYVALGDADKIAAIDTEDPGRRRTSSTPGRDPERIDISPDGKTLYVTNEDSNFLTFFNLETKERLGGARRRRRARGAGGEP